MHTGAVLIDIRPDVPAAGPMARFQAPSWSNAVHLEWRCDPRSAARIPEAVDHDVRWLVCCDEGYSSSLAAASLQRSACTVPQT
jgi:rhodanese-related sulfurtransferase